MPNSWCACPYARLSIPARVSLPLPSASASPCAPATQTVPTASARAQSRAFLRRARRAPFLGPRPCLSRRSRGTGQLLVGDPLTHDAAQHGEEPVAILHAALVVA